MLKISHIDKHSPADMCGLKKNDVIISFNEETAEDMLDVAYYDNLSSFYVTILRDNAKKTFLLEKDSYEASGWDFYDECFIEPRLCHNKCMFCFVDQLPNNMRETLYVKDDDWRLSFVSGNFVTLTNLSQKDKQRILTKKFSPLYVSVHATDDEVRRKLLGNSRAEPIMSLLESFAGAGIKIHAQLVLCPEINDGEILEKSLADLYKLFPSVLSVAAVPVGLTSLREKLSPIRPFEKADAAKVIRIVEKFDCAVFSEKKEHFAFCSDEMYVIAELPVPDYDYYGNFPQLENGVGLIADMKHQFFEAFEDARAAKKGSFTVVTGVAAEPLLKDTIAKIKAKFPLLQANVIAVKNNFFGERVTVAGLVVGRDILNSLKDRSDVYETLLLPKVMMRENENVFLDGMTLEELKVSLNKKIIVIDDGYELCLALTECE